MKLCLLRKRSGHEVNKSTLDQLTKYCSLCQRHDKSLGCFKFTMQDAVNFSSSIFVDMIYIDNSLILYMVDKVTRYQAAQQLQNVTAKYTWDILRLYQIDIYLDSSDYIYHDAGKIFVSKEFCQHATSLTSTAKSVPMKAYQSIGLVEQYYAILRQAYKVITEDLEVIINKKTTLQIIVKAVNDTTGLKGLVPTLLVFKVYLQMYAMDLPLPRIIQRATAIDKAMNEVPKIRAENPVADVLNTRNGPLMDFVSDLPLNFDVLV